MIEFVKKVEGIKKQGEVKVDEKSPKNGLIQCYLFVSPKNRAI